MKVLIVIPYFESTYGGPPKVVKAISKELAITGISVDLITTNANGDKCSDVPLYTWIHENNYRVRCFSCFYQRGFIFSSTLAFWVSQNLVNYDLVHTHTIFTPLISLVHLICQLQKTPYITTPHGMLEPWALSYKAWKKKPYYRIVENPALQRASAIQCLTNLEAKQIESLGFNNTVVVPNGINHREFDIAANPEIFYQEFPQTRNKNLILFLARIDPKKGLDLLAPAFAKAYQKFPNTHLIIAGSDNINFTPTVEQYFIETECRDAITFTGMLTGSLKSAALAASTIYVAPSYSEGFSMSVLEGMASGLPCVITTGCNFPEAAEAKAAFVVDTKVDNIANGLVQCLDNPQEAKAMGDRARKFIRENYTWDKIAIQMIDVYREILDKR